MRNDLRRIVENMANKVKMKMSFQNRRIMVRSMR